MTTITISVDDDIESAFRKKASERFQSKKGYLGDAVTQAMKAWLEDKKQAEIAARQMAMMRKGYHFGKRLFTTRAELHER